MFQTSSYLNTMQRATTSLEINPELCSHLERLMGGNCALTEPVALQSRTHTLLYAHKYIDRSPVIKARSKSPLRDRDGWGVSPEPVHRDTGTCQPDQTTPRPTIRASRMAHSRLSTAPARKLCGAPEPLIQKERLIDQDKRTGSTKVSHQGGQ